VAQFLSIYVDITEEYQHCWCRHHYCYTIATIITV